MPLVRRRPRTIAAVVVVALAAAGAAVAARAERPATVRAAAALGVAHLKSTSDVVRGPWYGMRVLFDPTDFVPADPPAHAAPPINAAGGIVVDLDAGTILWQQNAHGHLSPASTTKILTALVALENFSPSREVTVSPASLNQAWDETRIGLVAGQTLTVQELLTGMLLVSGNDAATAIAQDTVGLDRFVAAMNGQVAALGLHDSHFTSPVGLDEPNLYTSAYDLAVISATAVRHFPLFRQVVAMNDAVLPATAGHPEFDLQSINLLLSMYPAAVGIKPGWTGDAGYCEVGMAVRNGHRLISVLLNAPYDYSQTRALLDWGFVTEGLASLLPPPTPSPSPSPARHG